MRHFGDSREKQFGACAGYATVFLAACATAGGTTTNSGGGPDSGNTSTGEASASSSGASSGGNPSDSGSGSSSSGASSSSSSSGSAVGDGGSNDASVSDGGGAEAGADSGSAGGCAGKTYKLCEDFDEPGAMVGAIPTGWQLRPANGGAGGVGMVGLANDQAHSGTMSLKSDSSRTNQDRVKRSLMTLGPTVTKHWGRIFYKVGTPAPKPNNGVIHIVLAALDGTTENRVVDTVTDTSGHHQWLFNIPDDSCCTSSAYNWMFDASWHCAEWNIDVSAMSYHFYTDGTEVPQIAFTGRAGARMSNYSDIALGTIFFQQPPNPVVVWFDDLAIDDNRIGCQ